jgi:hypothetical protein
MRLTMADEFVKACFVSGVVFVAQLFIALAAGRGAVDGSFFSFCTFGLWILHLEIFGKFWAEKIAEWHTNKSQHRKNAQLQNPTVVGTTKTGEATENGVVTSSFFHTHQKGTTY